MRVLIINLSGQVSDGLLKICAGKSNDTAAVTVVDGEKFASELAGTNLDEYELFVINGSYDDKVLMDQAYFMPAVELVMGSAKPILAIGAGFEIICYAFNVQLPEVAERTPGAPKLNPTDAGAKIFQGTDPVRVSEAGRWNVDELPRELMVLAQSDNGIEAVKHKTRPIYGLQVQPQDFAYPSDANMVYKNILSSM